MSYKINEWLNASFVCCLSNRNCKQWLASESVLACVNVCCAHFYTGFCIGKWCVLSPQSYHPQCLFMIVYINHSGPFSRYHICCYQLNGVVPYMLYICHMCCKFLYLWWWRQYVFWLCIRPSYIQAKAGMVHSVSEWTRGVQVKLWDPLRTRAVPERLRGVFMTRCHTNPRLPLPLPLPSTCCLLSIR